MAGARIGTRVEAWRLPLPGRWTPAQALRALRNDDRPLALVGPGWGGAVVASAPVRTAGPGDDLFQALADLPDVAGPGMAGRGAHGVGTHGGVRVGGGWFGYLGYQLNQQVERLPPAPARGAALPAGALAYYDHLLCQDADGRWWFEALTAAGGARRDAVEARHRRLVGLMAGDPPPARRSACTPFGFVPGGAEHRKAVRGAVEHIRAGDIFQANVCLAAVSALDGDPLDLFCRGVEALHPAYGAFVGFDEGAVCSFSPELFLELRGRRVRTSPVKGTAPRAAMSCESGPGRGGIHTTFGEGAPAGAAERERRALEASAKDRAENVMIVDLMRNDLGRVCAYGTIAVPRLARAEPHPGLWHLVSDVTGDLRPDRDAGDLVRAAFPPGSCTGAPKVRAMEVINELEATARGAYTGAVGGASPLAGLTLNVAIRTVEWSAATGALTLGVGGGIVADSSPEAELTECLTKAGPIVAALGATLHPPDPARPPTRIAGGW